MNNLAAKILEQYWGYQSFRPLQEAIIQSVLNKEDTFALLPTGGGKSICYQVPALIKEGICIVISPLIALMEDQVTNLKSKGIKAIALTSGISFSELDQQLDNCIHGGYKFLYLSPERLQQDIVQERLKQMNISFIAVDEAHCISQWGNDFRPSYKKITILREINPTLPMIALTASATKEVVSDIITELDLFDPKLFKSSFYRPNLSYNAIKVSDKNYALLQVLQKHQGSAIIYVRNRKSSVALAEHLKDHGISAQFYHGGVDNKEKTKRFKAWLHNSTRVMVATTAFGMGIDKPDVRVVIHYDIPESIESYFQEAGRSGRDGESATNVLLYQDKDIARVKNQFIKVLPDTDYVKMVYRKLTSYFQISYGEGEQTLHNFNFIKFCGTYSLNTLITYNALQFLDRCGVIRFTQKYQKKTNLQFIVSSKEILDFVETNQKIEYITKGILRTYGGIFDDSLTIDLSLIAKKTKFSEKDIVEVLEQLQKKELVVFDYTISDAEILFLQPREDDRTINRVKHFLKAQNASKINKVHSILEFIEDQDTCKSQLLLQYFGESTSEPCGICNVCKKKNAQQVSDKDVQKEILSLLKLERITSRQLVETLPFDESVLLNEIQKLIQQNKVKINYDNTYEIIGHDR
ncbi:RecQ family ATP-dependent DNA helicase [Aquimarina brevivitae]|uniref:ATP-dependent DNA helicase RecQ n=1 Tax=Aquimarina brevivitae TaxID=323412 RepID=A0A4Q7NU31_9FLAO|nr:RecQ family ATP-dependent DNA helicase [Aquimarina brevivitae]RZS90693.1 ATP-dependent DNA helicase RecQ [Aquimarina brevivitae]